MNERLKIGLNKLISAHFSAVQTDAQLQFGDADGIRYCSLEQIVKKSWANYEAEHKAFKELLDSCVLTSEGYQG